MSSAPGLGCTTWNAGASGASLEAASMSSGSASTTGPGRPAQAVVNARATSSGIRSTRSICATHLLKGPNIRRKSTSWNASRSSCVEATCPTSRIIGVESWNAVCTPTAACVAPGPRVTMQMPGRPVSLP